MAKNSQQTLQQALERNLFTSLKDRVLFFDGDTVITPDQVYEFAEQEAHARGGNLCVTESTQEIENFNSLVESAAQIIVKQDFRELDLDWNIPEDYLNIDLEQYLADKLGAEIDDMSYNDAVIRAYRVKEELEVYESLDLLPVLRVIIYVINRLCSYKVVWGIGRGSCVASYVLYLIGVHDVDSVLYELDYTDFLRTSD